MSVAHKHRVGQTVVVSGVDSVFNGTWTITGVTSTTILFARSSSNIPFQAVAQFNTPRAITSSYYNGTFLVSNVTSNTISYAVAQPDETSSAVSPKWSGSTDIRSYTTGTSTYFSKSGSFC